MITEFSYNDYYLINFANPFVVAIGSFSILLCTIVSLFRSIKRGQYTAKTIVPCLIGFVICVYFIIINVQTLARGGIYLCSEKESEAVVIQGTIEEIEECDNSYNQKYGRSATNDGTTSFGVKILIEGNCYYAITSGGLQPGDDAIITYLPKSRFVLRISKSP